MLAYAVNALAYIVEQLREVFSPRDFDPESFDQYAEKNLNGVVKQRRCQTPRIGLRLLKEAPCLSEQVFRRGQSAIQIVGQRLQSGYTN